MILYNITVIVEDSILADWMSWITPNFISPIEQSGMLSGNKMYKVLGSPNEGVTICIQFQARSMESFQQFKQQIEPALMASHGERFQSKALAFTSLMEQIN